jgi:hypothetical protein
MAARLLLPFEILNRLFVFLRGSLRVERPEISPFSCLRIFLLRIQPIFAGFQFPDHVVFLRTVRPTQILLAAPPNIRSALEIRAR